MIHIFKLMCIYKYPENIIFFRVDVKYKKYYFRLKVILNKNFITDFKLADYSHPQVLHPPQVLYSCY